MFTRIFAISCVTGLIGSTALAIPSIEWDYNGQAIAAGTACHSRPFTDPQGNFQSEDTWFVNAGNEFSIVFSTLGVNLGDYSAPLAQRHNCTVRVPARVARGFYIGSLEQTLTYGVEKSANASGQISARAAFFGLPAANIVRTFPLGSPFQTAMTRATQTNNFQVTSFCRGTSALIGRYDVNLGVTGSRRNLSESVILQIDGEDIKFEAVAGIFVCPL